MEEALLLLMNRELLSAPGMQTHTTFVQNRYCAVTAVIMTRWTVHEGVQYNVPYAFALRTLDAGIAGMSRDCAVASQYLGVPSRSPPSKTCSQNPELHPSDQQQRMHVRRVLQAQNAFEVLQLPVMCSSFATVRTAYRKFALLLHPDKNAAHEAQKAFIRLSEAYEALRDTKSQQNIIYKLNSDRERQCEGLHGRSDTSPSRKRKYGSTAASTPGKSASPKSSTTSVRKSSKSFAEVLREWENFEKQYVEELRNKQMSVEAQARKELRRSRREDVEEQQAAERRTLLAHLLANVQDDSEDDVPTALHTREGQEREIEEGLRTPRPRNTWQTFLRGRKRGRRQERVEENGARKQGI